MLYLKEAAYYALKLEEAGREQENIRHLILNTLSVIITNPQFSEIDFNTCVNAFNGNTPGLISEYENYCKENNIKVNYIKSGLKYNKKTDIIKSIRSGEKEFFKRIKEIPEEKLNLYKLMFAVIKSLCINTLDLQTFDIYAKNGYLAILKALNSINSEDCNYDSVKEFIVNAAEINTELMAKLRNAQTERYGTQKEKNVSYSTVTGKAILVVGSNIRELENILESVKETDIDVYTHDEMMLAHTFPKFSDYKNLKGQYGGGTDGGLLDFSTFPGPIIMTRHSLYNTENLYRGRLFTTDNAYVKGVIPINTLDYSKVIESALNARGFKNGKKCDSEIVGFNYENFINKVCEKLKKYSYSGIVVIDSRDSVQNLKEYFDSLVEKLPDTILIIYLTPHAEKENLLSVNACYDSYISIKALNDISDRTEIPISAYFPVCGINTISNMIYLSTVKKIKVFAGKCTPIIFNPILLKYISKYFGINEISSIKSDIDTILSNV